jgi:hypothetical protein
MFLWKKLELELDLLVSVQNEESFSNNGLWANIHLNSPNLPSIAPITINKQLMLSLAYNDNYNGWSPSPPHTKPLSVCTRVLCKRKVE